MDLSIANKKSSRNLAISSVFFSTVGGMQIGWGIQQVIHARPQYSWINSFLFGLCFLGVGILWSVMLVRRTAPAKLQGPSQRA